MSNARNQKQNLLKWCNAQTREYDIHVHNLTTSWKSGIALCAILHSYDPSSLDFSELTEENPRRNIELALHIAEQRWGITKLIEPEDLLVDRVDSKQMYTYLSEYHRRFQQEVPGGTKKRKVMKKRRKTPDMSEAGLKKAMGIAMNRYNERGRIAELMRSQREGRMMEFLFPELKRQGYDREVLRKLGHELDLEDTPDQSAADSSGSTPPSPLSSAKEAMLPRSPTHVGKSLEFASRYPLEGEVSPRRKKRKKKSKKSYDQNEATARAFEQQYPLDDVSLNKDKIKNFMDKLEKEENSSGGAAFPSSNLEETGGGRMFTGSLDSNQQTSPPVKVNISPPGEPYIDPLDDMRFLDASSITGSEISALSNIDRGLGRSQSPSNNIHMQQIEGHFDRALQERDVYFNVRSYNHRSSYDSASISTNHTMEGGARFNDSDGEDNKAKSGDSVHNSPRRAIDFEALDTIECDSSACGSVKSAQIYRSSPRRKPMKRRTMSSGKPAAFRPKRRQSRLNSDDTQEAFLAAIYPINAKRDKMKELNRSRENFKVLRIWYNDFSQDFANKHKDGFKNHLDELQICIQKYQQTLHHLEESVHNHGDWKHLVVTLDQLYGKADDHNQSLQRRIRMNTSSSYKLSRLNSDLEAMGANTPKMKLPTNHSDPILPSIDEFDNSADFLNLDLMMTGPKCRICDNQKKKSQTPISLCKCTGEKKYMHPECFKSYFQRQADWWTMRCPECKEQYEGIGPITVAEQKYRKMENMDPAREASFLSNLGRAYGSLGNYEKKLDREQRALDITKENFGESHPNVARYLSDMGSTYGKLREYEKMRNAFEEALKIKEAYYGVNTPQTLGTLSRLAKAFEKLRAIRKQRVLTERILKIEQKLYGQGHANVARTLSSLGLIYEQLGEYKKAIEYSKNALSIQERKYGKTHPEFLAPALSTLGRAWGKLEDFEKSRNYLERALIIQEQMYGRDHAVLAPLLTNLGLAYGKLNQFDNQRILSERALEIKEREYGRDCIDNVNTLSNLARAYGELGYFEKHREYAERALRIQEAYYPPGPDGRDNAALAPTLHNVALAYENLGKIDKAREMNERAFAIEDQRQEDVMGLTCNYGGPGNPCTIS